MKKSFTLIEILVVATIIGLLAAIGAVSYVQINKSSRDAKRKADLENIRSAIEMYRSNNQGYPTSLSFATCSLGALTDSGGNKYLSKIPNDPKCTTYIYYYSPLPVNCDNSSVYCNDYTIAAQLEGSSSSCTSAPGGNSCGTNLPCNYCEGPYGQK